ncbi:MAG: ABC transporter ATP-binding protein [Myxococcales bacterium]|nr:ABC transporter ATP-binding protein [Myxococcales bacterium]
MVESFTALAVETRGLCKRYGELRALDGLDLRIATGSFYGLLGPNGAGKSTTLGLLTGLLRPSQGEIRLYGRALDPDDPAFKLLMGVVPEDPPLFERLTGFEQLLFTGRMFGLGREVAGARAADLLRLLRLEGAAGALTVDYSRGMRKKLSIGCALIHAPRLLFLDEPFENVDAISADTIRRLLLALTGSGATVLLTTHILEVAQKVCRRVGIIHRGKLVQEIDIADLTHSGRELDVAFRAAVGEERAEEIPAWLSGGPHA